MKTITKLKAAESQLITAIRLFFEDGDDIAIHTLTRASEEILDKICASKKVTRGIMYEGLKQYVKPELHKEIIKKMNEAKNFFKHADRDAEKVLTWNPKVSEYFIWDATSLHRKLMGVQKIPELIIYSLWFRLHHDDLWIETDGETNGLDVILPNAKKDLGHLSKSEFFKLSILALEKVAFHQ